MLFGHIRHRTGEEAGFFPPPRHIRSAGEGRTNGLRAAAQEQPDDGSSPNPCTGSYRLPEHTPWHSRSRETPAHDHGPATGAGDRPSSLHDGLPFHVGNRAASDLLRGARTAAAEAEAAVEAEVQVVVAAAAEVEVEAAGPGTAARTRRCRTPHPAASRFPAGRSPDIRWCLPRRSQGYRQAARASTSDPRSRRAARAAERCSCGRLWRSARNRPRLRGSAPASSALRRRNSHSPGGRR